MRWSLPTLVLAGTVAGLAQRPSTAGTRHLNPPTLTTPSGYTQVVVAGPGRTIYTAGQVARTPDGTIVGVGDFGAQARQAFANVESAVEAGGGSLRDVVKLTTYVVDMTQLPVFLEVRREFFEETPPASSVVQVARLGSEAALIQIEAVAVVPE